MSTGLQAMLRRCWLPFVTRKSRLSRRPPLVTLRRLLQRIPFRPVDVNCLYFLEYLGIPPQRADLLRGRAEVRSATLKDLDGLTKCQNTPLAFLDRFHSDEHCVVAVLDGEVVGYEWFCDKPFHIEERYSYKIAIPPDAVYAYDASILPEHRLAGIWLKFKSLYLTALMQRLHRTRIIGMVDYGNRIAMNTLLRFGFRPVGTVFVIKLFGKAIFLRRGFRGGAVALPHWVSSAHNAGTRESSRRAAGSVGTTATIGSVQTPNAPK